MFANNLCMQLGSTELAGQARKPQLSCKAWATAMMAATVATRLRAGAMSSGALRFSVL